MSSNDEDKSIQSRLDLPIMRDLVSEALPLFIIECCFRKRMIQQSKVVLSADLAKKILKTALNIYSRR